MFPHLHLVPQPLAYLPRLEGGYHEHVEAPEALEDDFFHSVLTRPAPLRREEVHHTRAVVVDLVVFGFELPFGFFLCLGHGPNIVLEGLTTTED